MQIKNFVKNKQKPKSLGRNNKTRAEIIEIKTKQSKKKSNNKKSISKKCFVCFSAD